MANQQGIKGVMEDVKGRLKQSAGTLLGNDQMEREGRTQQNKGESQQQVAEHESQAEQARQNAAASEQHERRQQ